MAEINTLNRERAVVLKLTSMGLVIVLPVYGPEDYTDIQDTAVDSIQQHNLHGKLKLPHMESSGFGETTNLDSSPLVSLLFAEVAFSKTKHWTCTSTNE